MSRDTDARRTCPRCGDSGVVRSSWEWCGCVLGTLQARELARRQASAPMDFSLFYQQRAIPFFKRDNDWVPVE